MDTQKYRAFLEVMDCGSITQAAMRMGYTQSAVSRMVADLEARWGVTLLHRRKTGTSPTADARSLVASMRAVCAAEDELESQVDAIKGLETGALRIATFSSVATHWLPGVVKNLQKDHPGITCDLLIGNYAQIQAWVAEGRADCGFACGVIQAGLELQTIGRDEFMAVLPRNHPMAQAEVFPVEAFAEEPFLQIQTGVEDLVARINAQTGARIVPALSTFDDYAIMAMVESGMGLAILPSLILRRIDYRIATLPLDPPAYRDILLVTRRNPESASMAAFRASLHSFFAGHDA